MTETAPVDREVVEAENERRREALRAARAQIEQYALDRDIWTIQESARCLIPDRLKLDVYRVPPEGTPKPGDRQRVYCDGVLCIDMDVSQERTEFIDLATRAIAAGKMDATPCEAGHYVNRCDIVQWAHGRGYEIPETFRQFIKAKKSVAVRFPTPAGSRWQDLRITAVDGHTIRATIAGQSKVFYYHQMDMENRRNNEPNKQWAVLVAILDNSGKLPWPPRQSKGVEAFRRQVSELRKRLKAFFGINDDPVVIERGYNGDTIRAKFRVGTDD